MAESRGLGGGPPRGRGWPAVGGLLVASAAPAWAAGPEGGGAGPGGGQGKGGSGTGGGVAVSADGRFVVFNPRASNLGPGDGNDTDDPFVRDRRSGRTEKVSLGVGGAQGDIGSSGYV